MKAPVSSPARHTNLSKIDKDIRTALINILRIIDDLQVINGRAINFNEISYISQNAPPTPEEGQIIFWRDSDATGGNPKAYLITMQGGDIFTFRSVEVV